MAAARTEIETAAVDHRAETGSTNEDALTAARGGAAGPLWIRADRQTVGRGRQGRAWDSPLGNLYCSLLLTVDAAPTCLPQLSHVAAVALADAIEAAFGPVAELRIKWPNDLLVGGAKVAGILVETTRTPEGAQRCVIGCGINCQVFPDGLPYRATSLSQAIGRPAEPESLFDALRRALGDTISQWNNGQGYAAIRQRWLSRALPPGTPLTVRAGSRTIDGTFDGIDDKGRLLLLGPEGVTTVEAGDVNLSERTAAAGG